MSSGSGVVGGRLECGLGDVVVSSLGEGGGRLAKSSRMDLLLAGWYTGMYFLRNFLFLIICLPDPYTLMRHW